MQKRQRKQPIVNKEEKDHKNRKRETANKEQTNLTHLGSGTTRYDYESPNAKILEGFENRAHHRDYQVELVYPEFTSLCPITGQPDFAIITIRYVPNLLCLESKSFKLYMVAFRNHGSFMETITNKILDDLDSVISPKWMQVVGQFNTRGGTYITVTAETKSE